MDITEVLQSADELVCTKTGQHLDDLQEAVVRGVWQGKTYHEIGQECNRTESRVRNVAHKLWKLLSEHLEEDINKSNFRSTFERLKIRSPAIIIQNNHSNPSNSNNFHVCPLILTKDEIEESKNIKSEVRNYHDLSLAPKITHFDGRDQELDQLTASILQQQTRLISVLGLAGIGKTTLVKRFVDLNLEAFDMIFWKSLRLTKPLDDLLASFLKIIDNNIPKITEDKLIRVFDIFKARKCLIILDDVQELFISGKFSGQYQNEYKDYKTLLTMMREIEHQSSLILISQEECQEMLCLDEQCYPVKCLQLQGLNDSPILKNQGLQDQDSWLKLIDLYEGHPVYLKAVANLIKNIYFGKVADFLKEDRLLLTEAIKSHLTSVFSRLSPLEQQIILKLSQVNEPLSKEDLKQSLDISFDDLINGLQSLNQRHLLKIQEGNSILFNLSSVLKAYIRWRFDYENINGTLTTS